MMKKFLLFGLTVAVIFSLQPVLATSYEADVSKWLSGTTPEHVSLRPRSAGSYSMSEPGVAWYLANYSHHEWAVTNDGGTIQAKELPDPEAPRGETIPFSLPKGKPYIGRPVALHVDDGWLVGLDAGEWGGSLHWFSSEGTRTYQISNDQVVQFITSPEGILAIQGLAHLTMSEGSIIKIEKSWLTKRWGAHLYSQLTEAPYAAAISPSGTLTVVTSSSILRVGKNGVVQVLKDKAFWWGMYPNSVVHDGEGNIYIGMRQGIAKFPVRPPNALIWLTPSGKYMEQELEEFNRIGH